MKQCLQDKVIVITGAGSGIGRATAEKLAPERAKIVLLGGNRLEKLEETRKRVAHYTDCLVIPGDLTDGTIAKQGIAQIVQTYGGLDVLINNAGMALNCPYSEVTEKQFEQIMAINVKAPFFLTQEALPYLKQSDCATVINLSSVVGHAGYPYQTAYVASKHALLGFTKSLAREHYQDNIRVHAICPGGVYTDMVRVARPDLSDEGMIQPEEIAEIIYFLLSNRGNAVVDEILVHRVNKEPFLV